MRLVKLFLFEDHDLYRCFESCSCSSYAHCGRHIGNCAESGALQMYMRHRTVQAAKHMYKTRLGLQRLIRRMVAVYVGECLFYQSDLTPVWLHGSSPKL
jgi:hypothetical protein